MRHISNQNISSATGFTVVVVDVLPARSASGQIHDITAPSSTQHQRGKSVAVVRGHLPTDARTSVTVYIDQRQTMGVGWNLKIDEGVVGTITLSRLLLLGPSDKFTVIIRSRSLYGCASYREVSPVLLLLQALVLRPLL